MSDAKFTAGADVMPLVFSVNPVYPCRVSFQPGSIRAVTEGGEEYVFDKGVRYAHIVLRFEGMPAGDFDGGFDYAANTQPPGTQSLANWFYNVAGPGSAPFTYHDPFGRQRLVTIMDENLEFSMTDFALYEGMINLKERIG